jgi:hypothetical protein
MLDALARAGAAVVGYATRRLELRAAAREREAELRAAATQARAQAVREEGAALRAWEIAALAGAGWKDEYWTVALSLPAILCFIPGAAPYVAAGFAALETCPDWYLYLVGIAVTAAFGVRPAVDFVLSRRR